MREAGVLLDAKQQPLYWHVPEDRSSFALPDSPSFWNTIWELRDQVVGFAHSHPGEGPPSPSWEDVTSFAAIEAGLGKRLTWWITSKDRLCVALWMGPDVYDYQIFLSAFKHFEPAWLLELRAVSNRG